MNVFRKHAKTMTATALLAVFFVSGWAGGTALPVAPDVFFSAGARAYPQRHLRGALLQ